MMVGDNEIQFHPNIFRPSATPKRAIETPRPGTIPYAPHFGGEKAPKEVYWDGMVGRGNGSTAQGAADREKVRETPQRQPTDFVDRRDESNPRRPEQHATKLA